MNTTDKDEIEIDLGELIGLLISKIWIIVIAGILTAVIAGVGSKLLITPLYTSQTQLFIVNKAASLTSLSLSDLQLGTQLTKDYMILVKSRPVTQEVLENLGLDIEMEHEDLLNIMTVSNQADTRILEISIKYPDPVMAKRIVDELTRVSAKRISDIMDIQEPNVVEYGYVAKTQTSPSIRKNTLIGGAIGVALAIFIVCLLYIMDDTIKSSEDVERYLGINTIGILPLEADETANNTKKKPKKKKKH